MSNELTLPNPGQGRYWDVTADVHNNYIVTLRTPDGRRIAEAGIYAADANKSEFQGVANELITQANNKNAFVGQYKFEEKN